MLSTCTNAILNSRIPNEQWGALTGQHIPSALYSGTDDILAFDKILKKIGLINAVEYCAVFSGNREVLDKFKKFTLAIADFADVVIERETKMYQAMSPDVASRFGLRHRLRMSRLSEDVKTIRYMCGLTYNLSDYVEKASAMIVLISDHNCPIMDAYPNWKKLKKLFVAFIKSA